MSTELLSAKGARALTMEIDHRPVSFPEGVSVLRAAELGGIYIPSLCSHKELSAFGGCRLCTVEIEGMRGYPLACSTLAQEGMKVLTDTVALREMRQEILQLILSEHPSSCLVCEERDDCRRSQYTIRKAGVSTGCRNCPNDGQCELQEVVERVGVTAVSYPVIYRGLEAEHDDPFFDRDYNICILCGRCVRMCAEVRGTSVLAFNHRGPRTLIGPAFGRNHVEAGCEFCGACVSVCPTGTLADKSSKWDGKPDGCVTSTCPFCSLGCQVEMFTKDGRLSRVAGSLDSEINDGQLCVRGRFCMPETSHHHDRAKKPMLRKGKYFREVDWDEALTEVATRLKRVAADEVLMAVSGDLTNEGLFAAQQFARECLGTENVDSTARAYLPGGADFWTRLFALPISMKAVAQADSVVVAGLDSRFYFSVAGVQVRRAVRRGASLVAVDSCESNLACAAHHWLRPHAGTEAKVLAAVVRGLVEEGASADPELIRDSGVKGVALAEAVRALAPGTDLAIVIGPRIFECEGANDLLTVLTSLASREGVTIVPLFHGANTRGALELCVLSGPPSERSGASTGRVSLEGVRSGLAKPKVIYLVGESPFFERPDCEFVIAQDLYLPPFEVDAFLPAASFLETEGTLTNIEGRVQRMERIEDLPDGVVHGRVRPDWSIFARLAEKLGYSGMDYADAGAVRAEIHRRFPGFPSAPDRAPRRLAPPSGLAGEKPRHGPDGAKGFVLVGEHAGFRHRGIDLTAVVEGLSDLKLEEGLRMNPHDMEELGIAAGGLVEVSVDGTTVSLAARPDPECPGGAAFFFHVEASGGLSHRHSLRPLYGLNARPLRVQLSVAGSASTRRGGGRPQRGRKNAVSSEDEGNHVSRG